MNIKKYIRNIPDFPKEGILFRDITPLLHSPQAMKEVIKKMADITSSFNATIIASSESRGFIFGLPLALELGLPFVPVRKKGKLPYKTYSYTYNLEYGQDTLEIHQDACTKYDNVIIVDDLLATGGTALACAKLIEKLGARVLGMVFLIELLELNGRKTLKEYNISSILQY